jgi:hypothetical protein
MLALTDAALPASRSPPARSRRARASDGCSGIGAFGHHEDRTPYAGLRADARGRDGRIREKPAARVVLRSGGKAASLLGYFVIVRRGAALGACSAGEITKVTQAFQPSGRFWLPNSQ